MNVAQAYFLFSITLLSNVPEDIAQLKTNVKIAKGEFSYCIVHQPAFSHLPPPESWFVLY